MIKNFGRLSKQLDDFSFMTNLEQVGANGWGFRPKPPIAAEAIEAEAKTPSVISKSKSFQLDT